MSGPDVSGFRRTLLRWGRQHRRSFPWRQETDPFKILVAEVLLQRSRGRTVAGVYETLLKRWPTAEALATARVGSIEKVIYPLGLTSRAKTLKAMASAVVARGGVPSTVEALMELPGVGRYAASATAALAFGRQVSTVDGVTARVYRRYFGLPSEVPASEDLDLWEVVARVTPKRSVREWNWAALDLAAAICLPKRPRCADCPLRAGCTHGRLVTPQR